MRLRRTVSIWTLMSIMAVPSSAALPVQARSSIIQGLQVTDPADTTFAVTFITTNEQTAVVRYGASPTRLTSTALDDRDLQAGHATRRSLVHRSTLSGLKYGTTYYFEPVVNGRVQGDASGRPFQQTTASLLAPRIPARIHGTVETAGRSLPPPGTVLLIGRWTNADGSTSLPVSVLNDTPNGKTRAGTYDIVPTLLTANGAAPFEVGVGATFHVMAEADEHGRLAGSNAVTARRGIHITIPPLILLKAPSGR
jgi:hypothetical protein